MTVSSLSPWLPHRDRAPQSVCDTVVLHATATDTLDSALDALAARGLSYHFLVDRDGGVTQCVPVEAVAYHAGESLGPTGPAVNEYSIGVSLVNLNDGLDPYSAEQTDACAELLRRLQEAVPTLRYLVSHQTIAPTRKTDPAGYPMEALAQATGLVLWLGS